MSTTRNDVDEGDRLARVKLSCTIEPGDPRVTALVSELGADKVLVGYLEAASATDAESHWAFPLGHELAYVDAALVSSRPQIAASASSPRGTPSGPSSSERFATPAFCTIAAVSRSGCG
jgi:hypothetical protein